MRAAWQIVSKHFQAETRAGVIAAMRKLRTTNYSLNETADHIKGVYPQVFRLLRTVSRVSDDIKTTAPGATHLFEDGEMFLTRRSSG
jgi:DNA-binding transcriptional ArsR family regulator